MKSKGTESATGTFLDNGIRFELSTKLYPLEAVYQAAYLFIDNFYVYLDRPENGIITVELRAKNGSDEDLGSFEGEFRNELLNQVVRRQVNRQSGKLRELIVSRAIFGALGDQALNQALAAAEGREDAGLQDLGDDALKAEQEELDRLLAEIEADFADDPMGIATPWDEKYGDKEKAETAENAADGDKDKS
jgi:His-Xaa-Ser system protein HxsD